MPVRKGSLRVAALAVALLAVTSATAYAQWTWTPELGRWVNARRQPRETAALQFQYADELLADGETEKAAREYEKLLRYFPDSVYRDLAQYSIGRALEAEENYAQSVKAYQKVIDEYPNTKLFGNVLEKQRKIADHYFQMGVERQEGFSLLPGSEFDRAIETYRQVIDNQPFTEFSAEAQYRIGLSYFKMELYDESSAEFQKLLDNYPTSEWTAEAMFGTAACKYCLALPHEYDKTAIEEATTKFNKFLAGFPESSRVEEARGMIETLRTVAARHDYNIAEYYHRNMRYESARMYFDSIVREYPETKWAEKASEKLGAMP